MTYDASSSRTTEPLARALGWFSIALGAAELAAPSRLARLIGASDTHHTRQTLRAFGVREVAAGVAILSAPAESRWLWSRVGGDVLDLAWLGRRLVADSSGRERLGLAAAAVAGVTALDVVAARRSRARTNGHRTGAVRVEEVVTVNRAVDQVYGFWRAFDNFPQFMRHLEQVEVLDERRSRWTATAPAGLTVQWDAEIVQDQEGEWLAWRSLPGSQIENSGSVRFAPAPGARGTEVRVQLEYRPPAGRAGQLVAMLFGEEPEQQVRDDLRRFKQLMEAGEIAVSDGPSMWRAAQPAGRRARRRRLVGVHA